ncbi:hypothetical protein D8M04_08340 [Oceanobacillus piezotolerans]|uniref:Uncharacterized protein n=1 Tax=Oceanobacillus piezotolerans TaxID=2448030 RepID=A0A498D8D3_9BACI|nr:hypothetical protein [Oceanobacillus piezotolerans]RLL44881.1 hypothetical protein D8M04_08340 [Oceanobacillus piezotolerans]
MSVGHYHTLCNRYRGRAVEIRTRDGRVHRGIIRHVDNRRVYLRPLGGGRNIRGFGYGYYGGYGYGGFGFGVALGAIATLALVPFFFW